MLGGSCCPLLVPWLLLWLLLLCLTDYGVCFLQVFSSPRNSFVSSKDVGRDFNSWQWQQHSDSACQGGVERAAFLSQLAATEEGVADIEVEVDDTSLTLLQQQLKQLSSEQADQRREAEEEIQRRGREQLGKYKFSLERAILLAGFAFQAYQDPSDSRWAISTADGTRVAFQNADFVAENFQGVLMVTVQRADNVTQNYNLAEALITGLGSDPFVTVELNDAAHFVRNGPQESKVVKSTASPVWGEAFYLYVSEPTQANLTLTLWDKELTRRNIEVGSIVLPLSSILAAQEGGGGEEGGQYGTWEKWLDLTPPSSNSSHLSPSPAAAEGEAPSGMGGKPKENKPVAPLAVWAGAAAEKKPPRVFVEAKYVPLNDGGERKGREEEDDDDDDDDEANTWSGPVGGTPGLDWRVLAQAKGLGGESRKRRWGRKKKDHGGQPADASFSIPRELSTRGFTPTFFLDNDETDTQVGAWRDVKGKRLVVSFRGTEFVKWKDLVTDASFQQVPLDFEDAKSDIDGDDEGAEESAFPFRPLQRILGTQEKDEMRKQMESTLEKLETLRGTVPESVTEALASLPGALPSVAGSLRAINANLDALRKVAGSEDDGGELKSKLKLPFSGGDGGDKGDTTVGGSNSSIVSGPPSMEEEMRGWFELLADSVKISMDAAQAGAVEAFEGFNKTAVEAVNQLLAEGNDTITTTNNSKNNAANDDVAAIEAKTAQTQQPGGTALAGGAVQQMVEGLWKGNNDFNFNLSNLNGLTDNVNFNMTQYMEAVWNVSSIFKNAGTATAEFNFDLRDLSAATERLAVTLDSLPKKIEGMGADALYDKVQSFEDALMELVVLSEPKEEVPMVHSGFKAAYGSARKTLLAMIEAAAGGPEHVKDYHILLTGHSLGGALAALAALDLRSQYSDTAVTCYTYGSPRVGNAFLAAISNELVPDHFRVVNKEDIIARMPRGRAVMRLLDYSHSGKTVLIDEEGEGLFWVEGESEGECALQDVDPLEMFLANRITEPAVPIPRVQGRRVNGGGGGDGHDDDQIDDGGDNSDDEREKRGKWAIRLLPPPIAPLARLFNRRREAQQAGKRDQWDNGEAQFEAEAVVDGAQRPGNVTVTGGEGEGKPEFKDDGPGGGVVGGVMRLAQRPMGFLERELKLLEGLTSGKALSHHFEADYYLAMSTCVLGKDKVKEVRKLTEQKRKENQWFWPG